MDELAKITPFNYLVTLVVQSIKFNSKKRKVMMSGEELVFFIIDEIYAGPRVGADRKKPLKSDQPLRPPKSNPPSF